MLKKIGLVLILVVGVLFVAGSWGYDVYQEKFGQAEEFFKLGKDEQALKVLQEVEKDFFFIQVIERIPAKWQPDFYWKLKYNRGIGFSRLGPDASSDAEGYFYQVANKAPVDKFRSLKADSFFCLSGIYLHRKDGIEQAIQYLEEALRLKPGHPEATYNLELLQKSRESDGQQDGSGQGQKTRELLKEQTKELSQANGGDGGEEGKAKK